MVISEHLFRNGAYFLSATESFMGQSFTTSGGSGYRLSGCSFWLRRYGSPTGTMVAHIYRGNGNIPTGIPIATTSSIDISTVPTSSFSEIAFTFPGKNAIANGVSYCLSIQVSYSFRDIDNQLAFMFDNTILGHPGMLFFLSNSVWISESDKEATHSLISLDELVSPMPTAFNPV